ncbi:hypothetical protein BRCH_03368c [Candidatus Burkholderia brachyanthoides]|nr:hypothetical protein BRCH_03368c [Candidatus Burkholderia brachyanthoides]
MRALLWLAIGYHSMQGAAVVVFKVLTDYVAFLLLAKLPLRGILMNAIVHLCMVLAAGVASAYIVSWPFAALTCVAFLLANAIWSLADGPFLRNGLQQFLLRRKAWLRPG